MWLVTVIKFGYDFVNVAVLFVAVLFGKSVSLELRYVFNMYIVSIICTQNLLESDDLLFYSSVIIVWKVFFWNKL